MELSKAVKNSKSKNEDIQYEEENSSLIFKNTFDNNLIEPEPLSPEIKIKTKKYVFGIPFIYLFFIFVILFTIGMIIIYILSFKQKENFYTFDIQWENNYLNNRNYTNYHFDNGLEVMLIQDVSFDMDGAAIVIDKGYLDNPQDEGIATFATILLDKAFQDSKKQLLLDNYFGNYGFETKDDFTNFRFDILNGGFKKYLLAFGSILNPNDISQFYDDYLNNIDNFNDILNIMESNYRRKQINNEDNCRENHLLEYLVYNFKDNNNDEIYPEGNINTITKLDKKDLKNKIIEYINKLVNPKHIKIVIFSKFKFLVSSKYMKKAFQYLINKNVESNENDNNELFDYDFNKSQILYIKKYNYEINYIKIIYFIDRIKNDTYSENWYKKGYFNYLLQMIYEKKEGSLYSTLSKKFNIKDIDVDFYEFLKSKFKFFIEIRLNSLDNINDIIFITYQFVNKIIKEAIGENMQEDRYIELKDIYNKVTKYTEKSFDTKELANSNGENIFRRKYKQEFYLYNYWVPWESNLTYEENFNIIKNETYYYFSQFKPENSVIILGLKNNDINNITCNDTSYFPLNCSFFKDKNNIKKTKYYDIEYTKMIFNSSDFEKYLDINNTFNISFVKNKYISKHNETFPEAFENNKNSINISQNEYNLFFFKKDINIRIPKVFISINLLHPYLRPLSENILNKKSYYFQILEFFAAINHKVNEVLCDAFRAGNEVAINYNENYLYINILCFEDIAYMIVNDIYNIIFNTNWEMTDFISNNEKYKLEAMEYFFNFEKHPLTYKGKYYFYCKVKNGLLNKYEFNETDFEYNYYTYFLNNITTNINNLNKFIVNGLIYGYYEQSEAEKIAKIFEWNREKKDNIKALLTQVHNYIEIDNYIYWTNEINRLNDNDPNNNTDYIDRNIIDKSINNVGFRYISLSSDSDFNSYYMQLSLLETMFNSIINTNVFISNYLKYYEMLIYRDIYFNFMLYEPNDEKCNPNNNSFVDNIFNHMFEEAEKTYKKIVDNIGDRFYYLQKNLELILFKKKSNLVQRAIEELNYRIYNYSFLNPEEIIEKYNENKSRSNYNFNNLKQFFKSINKNKTFDVNTLPSNN